eukprot:1527876-Prymnesium_polylepis.1
MLSLRVRHRVSRRGMAPTSLFASPCVGAERTHGRCGTTTTRAVRYDYTRAVRYGEQIPGEQLR